ncbi:MAG: glycoside hydrolase family 5 protein [Deinococcota bacterium]
MKYIFIILLLLSCSSQLVQADDTPTPTEPTSTIFEANAALGRAINLGNALEAPNEGDWGIVLEANFFDLIQEAGFDSVRVPIYWSGHALETAPYTIDAGMLERVDWVLAQAERVGLNAMINIHHYNELYDNPSAHTDRFLALWQQLASHYQDAPTSVYFELLNEPHAVFNDEPELWNDLIAEAVTVVRQSNPTRPLVIGPVGWNSWRRLDDLTLPDDPNLIVTVHYYDPFPFTHQGADWVTPVPPIGETWTGTRVGYAWEDWSWDTTSTSTETGTMQVRYEQGWGGLYLHSAQIVTGYERLELTLSGDAQLNIVCGQDGLPDDTGVRISNAGTQPYSIPLADCGTNAGLTDLALISDVPELQEAYELVRLELCNATTCLPLLQSEQDAINAAFDKVLAWSTANNRPIFLGEFGAYNPADMPSRVRWTNAAREAAEARDFSWSYWEFGAGFGIYDRDTNRWRNDLLNALIPPTD